MPQIDIDFEVFKALTNRRATEDVTYNDVLRSLLDLSRIKSPQESARKGTPWVVSDTSFPENTQFIAEYKGKTYSGVASGGKLMLGDGSTFSTPSAAAVKITGSNVNGWRFWKCKLPGMSNYVLLERLRGKAH